jgi:hypothetical protein
VATRLEPAQVVGGLAYSSCVNPSATSPPLAMRAVLPRCNQHNRAPRHECSSEEPESGSP